MGLFGLSLVPTGRLDALEQAVKTLSPPDSRGGWYPLVREPFQGAWQRNLEMLSNDGCLSFFAVNAGHTLICSDISKNRVRLVAQNGAVWQETANPAYSPVLRK